MLYSFFQSFEVDWDNIVPGRNGQYAKRRWHLMEKFVPEKNNLDFNEVLLEVLK